jgi:predicted nucleotidyltransferase
MRMRDQIIQLLRKAKLMLDSHGVAHLWLFGSVARDEAREDSDVDLLVEFSRPIGMFDFVRLQRELSAQIGRKVELVTRAALKPQLRDRILAEAVLAASSRVVASHRPGVVNLIPKHCGVTQE